MMKSEKINNYRFTVQFNENDPRHSKVASFLNTKGRHKAQILVYALLPLIDGMDASTQINSRIEPVNQPNEITHKGNLQQTNRNKSNSSENNISILADMNILESEDNSMDIFKSINAFRVK